MAQARELCSCLISLRISPHAAEKTICRPGGSTVTVCSYQSGTYQFTFTVTKFPPSCSLCSSYSQAGGNSSEGSLVSLSTTGVKFMRFKTGMNSKDLSSWEEAVCSRFARASPEQRAVMTAADSLPSLRRAAAEIQRYCNEQRLHEWVVT